MHGINTKNLPTKSKRAIDNYSLKLALEQKFRPEIRSYFKKIQDEATKLYQKGVVSIDPRALNTLTTELLKKQYVRTSRAFKNETRAHLEKHNKKKLKLIYKQTEEELLDEQVNQELAIFIAVQSKLRSTFIDRTTQKDIENAYIESQSNLVDQSPEITNEEIANAASIALATKLASRVNTIATTETQFMAEETKAVEITKLPEILTKEWAGILDDRIREDHLVADGQEVQKTEPFTVGGELLMYPGDTSLGATEKNVINCRCSALYS